MYSRRTPSRGPIRWLFGGLIILLTVAAFVLYQTSRPGEGQSTATQDEAVVPPTLTAAPTTTPRPVLVRIVSTKAQLSTEITELYYATDSDNWDLTHLGDFAGHLQGTPEMGQGGNYVLAGHVELKDGSRGPFADVHLLQVGDPITIIGDATPAPQLREYIVTDTGKVGPLDFGVIRNHGYEELTLVTCDDWDPSTQIYKTRVIVHARPASAIPRLTSAAATASAPTPQPSRTPTRTPTATATRRK